MPLKNDHRRPAPAWLAQIRLPEPDALESCNFPIINVLQHSLYYPAAGIDGRPVQFLAGFIHSFIYVDYGKQDADVNEATQLAGFLGYRVAGRKRLQKDDLAPAGWTPTVPQQFREEVYNFAQGHIQEWLKRPFADWYIFDRESGMDENHGPQRFSLIYICGDGIATYQALYWQNRTAPVVLTIIQPGFGFGGNYTEFCDPDRFLAWTVLHGNGAQIPEYLAYGGYGTVYPRACWPDAYPEHVEWWQHVNGNGVWRQRNRTRTSSGESPPS